MGGFIASCICVNDGIAIAKTCHHFLIRNVGKNKMGKVITEVCLEWSRYSGVK